jgi:hypothetical protein
MHYTAKTAVQAMVTIEEFALVALRMTFGGAANPSQWSDFSELATNLANNIIRDPGWADDELQSPHQHLIGEAFESAADDVPFGVTSDLMVDLPPNDDPKADCYIDDIFSAFLEADLHRGSHIIPFVIHLLGRPIQETESLARDDLLSIKKFLAEAMPSERKIVLGWLIDTRRLTIELPVEKHRAWVGTIIDLLGQDLVSHKELERLIGRLNHAGFTIPMARHFLSRLRTAQYVASRKRHVRLTSDQRLDLELWVHFLDKAASGISLNLLSFRMPTHITRSDASIHGIGGFSATTCIGWRWELPVDLRRRATLNSLEFLAAYVSIWMEIQVATAPHDSCFLDQTDSTSTTGWLRKSNFSDDDPFQLILARSVAKLVMDHESCLYSQWFPGVENEIADSLSRDFHLSDADLLHLFTSRVPDQMPEGLVIFPLPDVLASQIIMWMQNLPASTELPTAPVRSKLATGSTGSPSLSPSSLTMTPSLHGLLSMNSTESLPLSVLLSVPTRSRPTQVHQALLHQFLTQSEPPSMLWHRPSGLTTDQVPSTMTSATSHSFYSDSYEATRMATPAPPHRKLSHHGY